MKKLIAAAALVMAAAGQAQAGPIVAYTTPTSNNIIGEKDGYLGGNLYLWGGPAQITVEFIGKEAGFTNSFYFQNTLLYKTDTAPYNVNNTAYPSGLGDTVFNNVLSGLLNFSFATTGGVNPNTVKNGANSVPPKMNFFVSLGSGANFMGDAKGGANPTSGTVAIVALDDSGAGPDDNHDDLVVRLSITGGSFSVPDGGATLGLLGFALMGLETLRRKYRA